jgi:CDP-paratose 2-epimerase
LLSTSRVYSIPPLANLAVEPAENAFRPSTNISFPAGLTPAGVDETFSTAAPVSLYGATKLASETLALEYGETFGLPVFINRCGVLAGAGQFGRPDQGIFAFWINSHVRRRPLKYIGFGGFGYQVRDCLHPRDLAPLLEQQFTAPKLTANDRIVNVSGGISSARSLHQLTAWCDRRFGRHPITSDGTPRQFDIPWIVLDHRKASRLWNWQPQTTTDVVLSEIASHAEAHPAWLDISAPL